jgi:hypothetical protein
LIRLIRNSAKAIKLGKVLLKCLVKKGVKDLLHYGLPIIGITGMSEILEGVQESLAFFLIRTTLLIAKGRGQMAEGKKLTGQGFSIWLCPNRLGECYNWL